MKNSELSKKCLDENTFWHITSKLNIKSIKKNGLVPHNGKRNGKLISPEDPVARVFFSQGLEGVLGQANNMASIIDRVVENIERTDEGDNGKNVKEKMDEFLNNEIEGKDAKNGGFIDIITFIKEDMFKNGINMNLNEQDLNKIIYDIAKTIWKNEICLKVNIKEGVDYSWKDTNYSATGDKKRPMTKKNMHTFEGHTVTSDKIEIITDESGKPRTTWDVFKEMALFYKKEYPDKEYLPVEEWQEDRKFNHEKDYLSMFIEIEKSENEKKNIRNVVEKFARDRDVALKKEEAKAVFEQLEMENENIQESPSLSE